MKQRWHVISDRAKAIYVAIARLEEEQTRWDSIQSFYKERITTARLHASMRADPDYVEPDDNEKEGGADGKTQDDQ